MIVLVPLHVSGIWVAKYSDNYLEAGSIGAGLNLTLYAIARATPSEHCEIETNKVRVFREQAENICRETGTRIRTEVELPVELGKGFAASSAVIVAHSILAHAQTGRPLSKALQLAHVLEVKHRTGLGDVIAQWIGGMVVRIKPGAPGVGTAYRVIPRERVDLIVAELKKVEDTSVMLSRIPNDVYRTGEKLLKDVIETEDLRVFFENAKLYTSLIFDYAVVHDLVEGLKGLIGYYMKKSALIAWIEREYLDEALQYVKGRGIKAFKATISQIGVNLAHTSQSPEKRKLTYKREAR